MTTTDTMTALVQYRYGAPSDVLRIERVARPVPGEGEVLVRVRATSVNTPDWLTTTGAPYFVRGIFGLLRPRVAVRGTDVAGVVEAVGPGVTDLRPGDAVLGSTWVGGRDAHGTFAELTVARAAHLARKPDALSFADAAASVMSGVTALTAMRDVAAVRPGMRVLVHGASGGVGTFAVQIAKALGAEVTGVCSTRNVELLQSLGAAHVVDYTQDDPTRTDARYDVVLDDVMDRSPRAWLRLLTPAGVYLPNSVGRGRWLGALPKMAWAKILGGKRTRSVNIAMRREILDALVAMIVSGDVRVVTDRTYALSDAAAAVAHMMTHRARGKLVVTV